MYVLVGKVKVTYCNGDKFEGEFYRGEKMGQGTMHFAKGNVLNYIVRLACILRCFG